MKIETFFEFVEDLYGKYSDAWKAWIVKYLKGWDESDITDLFQFLILRHRFNNPPNLAAIEDARREFADRYDKTLGKDWYTFRHELQLHEKEKIVKPVIQEERISQEESDKYFEQISTRLKNGD